MTYHALVSPQGCTEVNATVIMGKNVGQLQHGKWYSAEELMNIANPLVEILCKSSPLATEKNIKKWRYERQA